MSHVGEGTAGQVLQAVGSTGGAAYSTATYPKTAGTSGKVLISDGTNIVSSTATYPSTAGTSGNVLTSDGTNFTSATPGIQLIQVQDATNSATISFTTGGINTTYKKLLLSFKNVQGVTDAVTLRMQMSNDGGSTWTVTGYTAGINHMQYNSVAVSNTNSTTNFILTGTIDNTTTTRLGAGEVNIYLTSANDMYISGTCTFVNDTGAIPAIGIFGGRGGATGANAFRLLMSSGNISTGRFYLYGYRDS